MLQGGLHHGGSLRVPSCPQQELGKSQRRRSVGGVGLKRLAVAGFRFRGASEHFQHQGAVGQGSGAGRTRGAVEDLTKERQGPSRIAAHREGGGGGGADAGRNPFAARLQDPVEKRRRSGRIPFPQSHVGQPARGAQRGAVERFARPWDERGEGLGRGVEIPQLQMRPRPTNVEGRIPRVSKRRRVRDTRRFHGVAPVEQ